LDIVLKRMFLTKQSALIFALYFFMYNGRMYISISYNVLRYATAQLLS
jgi:hypothetical protein